MEQEAPHRSLFYRLLSLPLRFKITIPYLIVVSLLAVLVTYQVSRSYFETIEERFRSQLEEVAFGVNDGIAAQEEFHLQNIRTIVFTVGVADAVAAGDARTLSTLVYPHVINNQLFDVDLLDARGFPLLTWHRASGGEYRLNESTNYADWEIVQRVLAGESDEIGDKFVGIYQTPWGEVLYTSSPIYLEQTLVGILLIGTPLPELAMELSTRSIAGVAIYDSAGKLVVSTSGYAGLPSLSDNLLELMKSPDADVPARRLTVESRSYVEALEAIYLRGEPSGWIFGVTLPESMVREAAAPSLMPLIVIFIFALLILIGLGIAVAQGIAIPVFRLLSASQQVGAGNLDVAVESFADDEIGKLTASFNNMIADLRQRDFVREMFGRMVSEDVSEAILQGEVALGGEVRYVSVLFTDVRGFTALSERFPPEEVISLLNEFFAIITQATRKYQGVVNHFGGDSVLAVFGAPIERSQEESLQQAIHAAIEVRRGVVELNAKRISDGNLPLRFGVGINSGSVIAGNIGTEDRFQYTVIGDVVNVAARLQGISRQFPRTPLLIPNTGVQLIQNKNEIEFQYLGEFRLRGKARPVSTYAIIGLSHWIPPGFTLFDGFPYPQQEALLALYLYCKGYSSQVIGETLQLSQQVIETWISLAAEHADQVEPVLLEGFDLTPNMIRKLLQVQLVYQGSEFE